MSEIMMRHLLGSDEKLEHDPGAEGPSGEGAACLVMMFLVISAAIGILVFGEHSAPLSSTRRLLACANT